DRLRGSLHALTRKSVAQLVRSMNSYYSNLIEGHRTTPRDIDAALAKDFSNDEEERANQILHLAHVEAQIEMEERLKTGTPGEICATDFICWLHGLFYERLPESFLSARDPKGKAYRVIAGEVRQSEVSVGQHLA